MEIKKKVYLLALLVTLFLLVSILILSKLFDEKREDKINQLIQTTYNNLNEMQIFMLMSEIYGDEFACIAFNNKLKSLDKSIWDLGIKIDQYRIATEEFQKDPFYLSQKKIFNENEVFYMMLLAKLNKQCGYNQKILSFFYRNSRDCNKCDDQSFVLSDIKKEAKDSVSVFSYDTDLNITTINLLIEYYNLSGYPCILIDNKRFCGMLDKNFIINKVCESSDIQLCAKLH